MTSQLPDFPITSYKKISGAFLEAKINSFQEAFNHVKNLPYKRNSQKDDLTLVLKENGGTCSTKHALLVSLAHENDHMDIHLMMGIFRMNGKNTPKIQKVLQNYNLEYIPEAHNYIKHKGIICDCTSANSDDSFSKDLLVEIEISPEQISSFKIVYHKQFIQKWISSENSSPINDGELLWKIREECIAALSG